MKINSKKSKGQSVVELVITLPILMLILCLTVSTSLFIYDKTVLQFAANQGLDKAIGLYSGTNFTSDEIQEITNYINNEYSIAFATKPDIEVVPTYDSAAKETTITVKITSNFNCGLPYLGKLFDTTDNENLKAENSYVIKDN